MRRGSAVLLTILPLLSPAYGLPTYFGNDAAVAHANVERSALPGSAVNLDTAEIMKEKRGAEDAIDDSDSEALLEWLPKSKRQSGSSTNSGLTSGSVSLDVGGTSNVPSTDRPGQPDTIANLGSEGSANWLRPIGRPIKLAAREAEAKPNPAVTMELGYIPPSLDTGNGDLNLGGPPVYTRRTPSV
ncbi:MAG: hypothetical protein LQ343_002163 [Gyalolechia ehrenbergii]|nr:MAG: hypothetical protein LQ343_002163 [Gyalolechia ehrenbergii]